MRNTPEHCSDDTINTLVDFGTVKPPQASMDAARDAYIFYYFAAHGRPEPMNRMRQRLRAGVGLDAREYWEAFGYTRPETIFEDFYSVNEYNRNVRDCNFNHNQ